MNTRKESLSKLIESQGNCIDISCSNCALVLGYDVVSYKVVGHSFKPCKIHRQGHKAVYRQAVKLMVKEFGKGSVVEVLL